MSNPSNQSSAEDFFGEVISSYTRAQAIEDGMLIDASEMGREVGFRFPVAVTSAVWADCIEWAEEDSAAQVHQDLSGRLRNVLFMAAFAIQTSRQSGDRLLFELYRVPRDGYSTTPVSVTLKLVVGPGDTGEPVLTVLFPNED